MANVKIADTRFLNEVDARGLAMIQARYDGVTLVEMAKTFNYSSDVAVANAFAAGSKLRQAYDEYKDIMHQAFMDETINCLKKAVGPATKTLIANLASENPAVSNAAAKYLLDRELGSPKQQVEHSGEVPLQIIINAPKPEPKVVEVIEVADGTDS